MVRVLGAGFLYCGAAWLWSDMQGGAAFLLLMGAACNLVSTLKEYYA